VSREQKNSRRSIKIIPKDINLFNPGKGRVPSQIVFVSNPFPWLKRPITPFKAFGVKTPSN